VGLINVEGFFDGLLGFLDHLTAEQFMRREHREMLLVASDPDDLLERFESYRAPVVEKWIRREEW
jgi:predicted Rossmann-fold nucleotide-binding protein